MAIIGGGVWLGTNRDPAKAPASEKPATSAAPASPTTSPWHSIGGYTIGMGIEEAKRLGATNCKTSTQGQECSIPDGNAFGAPYSRGHISFAGAPATASQIRVGVNASVMPAVTATLGQPSIRKGGSRKILYWNRGEDIVVSRTSETLSVSRQPSLASQLIPRK
jgi:hypothetical protein